MKLKHLVMLAAALAAPAANAPAAQSSANYTITTATADASAVVVKSGSYAIKTPTIASIAGTSATADALLLNKAGFAAQLFDFAGLTLSAGSLSLNEGATTQLAAAELLDDATKIALDPTAVTWSINAGPIASVSSAGLVTALTIFQDTPAQIGAAFNNSSAQLNLTIVNSNNDNFGAYADDGLDDAWQVQFFGQPPNSNAAPNADPDGDGATNLAEFQAGTDPTFPQVRLLNISTRMRVLTNDNVLIGGFIVTGTAPKKVLIRAIGPSLRNAGIAGVLSDPTLELHAADGTLLTTNDNWKDAPNVDEISATGIPPSDDAESAIVQTLAPGAYTAIMAGKNDSVGVGLVEAYDLDQSVPTKLANISTRGFVDVNDNVMIGGLIVNGSGTSSPRIVLRAIGPSLAKLGVQGVLQDPLLELHDGSGALVALNDNWKDSQEAELQATGIAPSDDRESAIVRSLAPGNYTAIVRGSGGSTGVALVEAFNLAQ